MKKSFFSLGFGLTLATAALASTSAVQALNAEISRILAPFQNEKTVAKLEFQDIRTNETHTLALALNGLYRKFGSQNRLEIRLDNVSYNYGNGTAPTTNVVGGIGIDLTKLMPQEDINLIVPEVESMLQNVAQSYARDYGDAVNISAKVLDKQQDAAGNYVSIKVSLSAKIDLLKLPESMPVQEVLFTGAEATLNVNVTEGIELALTLVSNPFYKGFQRNGKGLKDSLDELLARDPEQIRQIQSLFKSLDGIADEFVDGKTVL